MSVESSSSSALFWFTFLGLRHSLPTFIAVKAPLLLFWIIFLSLGCCRSQFLGFIFDLFTIVHLLGNTISSLMSTLVTSETMLITPLHGIYLQWNCCWSVICTNVSYHLPNQGYGHQPISQGTFKITSVVCISLNLRPDSDDSLCHVIDSCKIFGSTLGVRLDENKTDLGWF